MQIPFLIWNHGFRAFSALQVRLSLVDLGRWTDPRVTHVKRFAVQAELAPRRKYLLVPKMRARRNTSHSSSVTKSEVSGAALSSLSGPCRRSCTQTPAWCCTGARSRKLGRQQPSGEPGRPDLKASTSSDSGRRSREGKSGTPCCGTAGAAQYHWK